MGITDGYVQCWYSGDWGVKRFRGEDCMFLEKLLSVYLVKTSFCQPIYLSNPPCATIFFFKTGAYSVQGSTSGSGPSGVMAFGFISP